MLEWIRFSLTALLLLSSAVIFISEILGVGRFRYVLNRMHAAAMGDTLGVLFVLGGLAVLSGFTPLSLKLLLTVAMLWLTSPVSSHLIGRLDTMTAPAVENEIQAAREKNAPDRILVDCSKLDFISSAGLRVILRLKKAVRMKKMEIMR